ncbi:UNVERIFIED_CONTAM: hypothetical protein Scaly_2735500 [Sesamum calycinum]|uniref:DUF7781 domain-containing protein n=1 Tax=Sesamum calycinum TaxID=2727403 RepID=A0AAW2J0S5_9LAMI
MEGTSNGEEPASWEELYNINLMPSEIFLKFRKELQGFRVGVNLEEEMIACSDFHQFISLKEFAIRPDEIRNKTSLGLCPGVDFRFGWRADYVLPEITGGVGSDEPLFNMKSGRLQASLDRIEAIFTHADEE